MFTMVGMDFAGFERLARGRRAVRDFRPDPLPEGLLEQLLDASRWAPSGYNLQPTHFVVVTNPELKPALRRICLNQRQVEQAPATVVFLGDRQAYTQLGRMLATEEAAGTMHPQYRKNLQKNVPLVFHTGPAGFGWLWKATLPSIRRLAIPTPELPAVHRRYWLAKQVSLSAMVFMLGAASAGLGTCPMEGFDEGRLKRLLKIPARMVVVMVIPVGYSADSGTRRSRMDLAQFVHVNAW